MEFFRRVFRPTSETTILDVGGTDYCWRLSGISCRLTLCNLDPDLSFDGFCEHTVADGCALPFPDKSFDVVFSNSTIEHVGDLGRQTQFAREIRRVGRSYWVQTPNKWFPIEPHYLLPFVQFLPFWLRWRAKYISPYHLVSMRLPTREEALGVAMEIRLPDAREMRTFFPDSELYRERLCGLTKSLVAYKL
jgi:SAM-dependent methyltransferase